VAHSSAALAHETAHETQALVESAMSCKMQRSQT